ncbi:MAG: hypothetical protein LC798_12240 [Chloroflexi bacterium]|nr:hypothetical protein [Chloroflexota bacterium]
MPDKPADTRSWHAGPPRALPLDDDDRAPLPDELGPLAESVCELAARAHRELLGGVLAQVGYALLADGRRAAVICQHREDWRNLLAEALTAGGRPVHVGLAGGVALLDPRAAGSDPNVAVIAYPSIPALRTLVLGPRGIRGALIAHAPAHGLGTWEPIAVPGDDELVALIRRVMARPKRRP